MLRIASANQIELIVSLFVKPLRPLLGLKQNTSEIE
jgi:hypothetical protein